jgi:hypothetical protein
MSWAENVKHLSQDSVTDLRIIGANRQAEPNCDASTSIGINGIILLIDIVKKNGRRRGCARCVR